jgi:hypothetical protein
VARIRTIVVLPAPLGPSSARAGLQGEIDVVEHNLRELIDQRTYPRLHQIAWSAQIGDNPSGFDEHEEYQFGLDRILDRILDGIETSSTEANHSPDNQALDHLQPWQGGWRLPDRPQGSQLQAPPVLPPGPPLVFARTSRHRRQRTRYARIRGRSRALHAECRHRRQVWRAGGMSARRVRALLGLQGEASNRVLWLIR